MLKNQVDATGHPQPHSGFDMAKHTKQAQASFGHRLATLRKAAGFTQQELADEIGASRRMIAYYEAESDHPPANLLA